MANLPGYVDHPSILSAVGRWWRNWRHREFAECDALSGEDLERMARDVGVPASELKLLMRHPDDEAELLRRRMVALRIDPNDVSWFEGAVLRDMQRACTLCDSRAACIRDLAHDPVDLSETDWRDYCPNAATLGTISTLKACSAEAGRDDDPMAGRPFA